MKKRTESVQALSLKLYGTRVGIIVNYSGGKNILTFDPGYTEMAPELRPVLTLQQLVVPKVLTKPQMNSQRVPPILSNLLPEGPLREWMAKGLKVHLDNEFPLLAYVGSDLPGALVAEPISGTEIPDWALVSREQVEPVKINVSSEAQKFSLAGVQMKFSSAHKDGRYNIGSAIEGDNWIIKTPSTQHRFVPENEYSSMLLAETAGIDIPMVKLVKLSALNDLPDIRLPDEGLAYAIRRFDRTNKGRVHTEDFAQVLDLYAHQKYGKANYEQVAGLLYEFVGLDAVQEMARRLLVNILLGNGDAHLKNWSLIYYDKATPSISPAYDILFTTPYVPGEDSIALNLSGQKKWANISYDHFQNWSRRINVPWPAIRVQLNHVMKRARDLWPKMLADLPMHEDHKKALIIHWAALHTDFKIA